MYIEIVFWLMLKALVCFGFWEVGRGGSKMNLHQVHNDWSGVTAAWAVFVLYYHRFLFFSPVFLCPCPPHLFFSFFKKIQIEELKSFPLKISAFGILVK